ncbi:MAG: hypothetical protein QNJ33_04570 [Crocosphaera sp.]|nr:hypothetical protein [Crocosphaera sp.]
MNRVSETTNLSLIVHKASRNILFGSKEINYKGMDRPKLGEYNDLPQALILEGLSLDDMNANQRKIAYKSFIEKLLNRGIDRYELITSEDQIGVDWEFLGYDVGELTKRAWSAIANCNVFVSSEEQEKWISCLNSQGLFQVLEKAEEYLELYLSSNDPDMGWDVNSWQEAPSWYCVIPIYRYIFSISCDK